MKPPDREVAARNANYNASVNVLNVQNHINHKSNYL